jgi:hypothetical protein
MAVELLDFDPTTGMQTLVEFDETNPKKFHIHHRQDVTAILERNKELQKHPEYKRDGIKRGMQHVASIPDIWAHFLLKHKGINVLHAADWPKLRQILKDPQFKHLRATLGDI